MHLGEATHPSRWQRHRPLDDRTVHRRHREVVGTDRQTPVAEDRAVEAGGQDVEPRVDAAAAGEGLEPQPVGASGDDRVEASRPDRPEVAGAGDLGDRQQAGGRGAWRREEPSKNRGSAAGPPLVCSLRPSAPDADGAR
jgi:hypothetical protein